MKPLADQLADLEDQIVIAFNQVQAIRAQLDTQLSGLLPPPSNLTVAAELTPRELLRLEGLPAGWWECKRLEEYLTLLFGGMTKDDVRKTKGIRPNARRKLALLEFAARVAAREKAIQEGKA